MLPPSVDYAVCYAAAAKAGAITTGLNTRVGRREVDAILRQRSPALVVRGRVVELRTAGTSVLARSELAAIGRGAADGVGVADGIEHYGMLLLLKVMVKPPLAVALRIVS